MKKNSTISLGMPNLSLASDTYTNDKIICWIVFYFLIDVVE